MGWPLSQDYNEAIQSPARNFADPDLRGGKVVTNALGLPMPCSGNFADVYQVSCPNGSRWAVKCFTREVPGLRERYQEISRHLQQAKLPFTVDFTYLEQGIRVAGKWYPVLKMQWVEGLTLNQFVSQYLDKPAMLEALLRIWARMEGYLRTAKVAHCDLQHGNVLLVPGPNTNSLALKLIDYDGMWVPALAGTKSGEVGHASYQHPLRLRERTYSPEVDRFPLLLIATALSALKVGGRALWEKYNDGDNLLFRQEDLETPNKSALFYELLKLEDRSTHFFAEQLIDSARKPLEQTPLLEDLLQNKRSSPVSVGGKVVPPAAAEAPAKTLTPSSPQKEFASFQPGGERKPRRRKTAPVWVALVVAMLLVGVVAVVIVLVANNGIDDPKEKQNLNRIVHSKDKTDEGKDKQKETRDKQKDTKDKQKETKDKQKEEKKTSTKDKKKEEKKTPTEKDLKDKQKEEKKTPTEKDQKDRPPDWRGLANMHTARSLLAAVTGPDGRIYAIGGQNASGGLDTVEVYDPSTNTWAKAAPMPTARNHLAATMGPDNLIYAIGGVGGANNIVEAYNPTTNKWTTVAPMPTARHGLAAVTGPDGRIYAIGGNGPNGSLNTVEAYDMKSNTWATVANMPTARVYFAAATGPDGRIYAIGGFQEPGGKRLNTVEAYDTKTNSWTTVASMTTARNSHAAATGPDGRIYALGGHTAGPMPNIVEAYDTKTNTWNTVASMPTVRGQLAATTGRDGRIYAIGGGGTVPFLNTVEVLIFSPRLAPIDDAETEKFRAAIHMGVNDLRAEKKLAPLVRNAKLDASAQKHADNMAWQEKLAHELDGKTVKERTEAEGYEAAILGENVGHVPLFSGTNKKADGLTAVATQVKGWKGSPGHYAVLMTDYLLETGVGIAQTKSGKWYLCQVFSVPKKK